MPASSKPDPQPANTYPMQQRSSEERNRLRLQDASALALLGLIPDQELIFRTALPFLQKWVPLPADYEATYQQMVSEIHQPDFSASVTVVTVWGTKEERSHA